MAEGLMTCSCLACTPYAREYSEVQVVCSSSSPCLERALVPTRSNPIGSTFGCSWVAVQAALVGCCGSGYILVCSSVQFSCGLLVTALSAQLAYTGEPCACIVRGELQRATSTPQCAPRPECKVDAPLNFPLLLCSKYPNFFHHS